MTQSQDLAVRTNGVIANIENPAFLTQLEESLPEGVSLTKFKRIAISTIRANTDLLNVDETSLFGAIVKCAQDGLLPDGREAAIIKRGNYASYTPMIDGIRKIAAEHGWTIRTALVYQHDEFDHAVVDGEESIVHRPVRPGVERGEIIATYAIAKHRDGRKVLTVLHPADVAERQALAQTDKVWKAWKGPMWEKSAGHDVFGQLGLAESDKRVKSMLDALAADAGDARRLLYGGTAAEKSGVTTAPSSQTTTSPPPGGDGDATQQAGPAAAATPVQTPAAAEPVPGDDAEVTAAAQDAAKLVPPSGVHANAGRTLAQIHALGADGTSWFGKALRKTDLPDEFRVALFNYARVYLPELFDEVIAEREVAE